MKGCLSRSAVAACLFLPWVLHAALPAFPGAEGFGANALGGRGGDVYHVVNLNSSGAGSFANGIATVPAKGRTIVFDVGGWIHLAANTKLTASNVTIAGQTAPGDGIGLKDGTFWIYGDNVIVRHVRFRYGDQAAGGDCIDIDSAAQNVLFDHCTFEFSTDENFSTWSPPENLTMQDCINAWGLDSHSCGGLLNAQHMSVIRCLWAHNHTRNPKARPDGLLDWLNNVTFDWDIGFILGDSTTPANWKANVRGCYFVSATSKNYALEKASLDRNGATNFFLYLDQSVLDGNNNGVLDATKTNYTMASGSYGKPTNPFPQTANGLPVATNNPLVGVATTIDPALLSYKKVLSSAGPVRLDAASALPLRDEVDTILMGDVFAQTRRIISSQSSTGAGNGGFGTLNSAPPPVDTDKDGMPDFWETAMSLNTTADDHTNQVPAGAFLTNAPAGYTALEEYLHWLATPHAFSLRNQMLSVDLRRFTMGFTNRTPVYAVSGAVNGTVAVTNGVYARFWPTSNAFGRASFLFAVTDADGSAWTQKFLVCVSPVAPPKSLLWRGDGVSNHWNNLAAANWHDGSGLVTFGPGDTVTFDDTGSNAPAINLVSPNLAPASIEFLGARNFTLGGTGALTGAATLFKSGTGTLSFANTGGNTFTGGVTIAEGRINVSAYGQLGTGPLTLAGGSFGFNSDGSLGNDVAVPDSGTIFAWNNCWMSGRLAGDGLLWLSIPGGDVITPQGVWTGFTGTVDLGGSGGTLRFDQGGNPWGSAAASFVLGNAGTLKNRATGAATIPLGLLSGGASSKLHGSDQGGAVTDTYLVGARGGDAVFAGTIADAGAHSVRIVKSGAGAWTLGGHSTFTGGLIVSNGTLVVNGATGTGTVSVLAGTLGGTGRINGATSLSTGATLAPGQSAGTLSISNGLALSNALLRFELSMSPAGLNDQVVLTNAALRLLGTNDVLLAYTDGFLGPGSYALVRGGTQTVGSVANLRLNGIAAGSRQQVSFSAPTGQILLNVTGSVASLTWRGTSGSAWDHNATTNWINASNAPDTFFTFDAVRFDDSATNGTVAISNAVVPRAVEVANTSRFYTIGGGSLSGAGMLTKSGPGALTLSGSNGFSGGVLLNGGSITLANDTANTHGLGTGPLTIQAGTLFMYDNTSYNNSYWDLAVPAGATGTVWADSRVDFYGDVSGGGVLNFRVPYVRTTLFGNWSSFTGRLNVTTDGDGGDFRIGPDYAWPGLPGAAVNLADRTHIIWSGNINASGGTTVPIGELSGTPSSSLIGGSIGWRTLRYRIGGLGTDAAFHGKIGEQTNAGVVTAIEKVGAGAWTLTGTNTYAGGTTVAEGALYVNATGASGTGSGGVVVEPGARISGRGVIGGPLTVGPGAILAPGATNLPGILYVLDDASISEGAELRFRLGATNSDCSIVYGSLQLGGTVHITDSGGFAGGIFTLFLYDGELDLGALSIASAPTGYVYSIETNSPGAVELYALTPFMQWQLAQFGSLTNPLAAAGADFDGDGFRNEDEFRAGTQPTNSASLLLVTSEAQAGTNLVLNWKTAGVRTNWLQVSVGSPTNFTDAAGPFVINAPGDASTNASLPLPTNSAPRFYRVRLP